MKRQRKYKVIFRNLDDKSERTVTVLSTDSINASICVYKLFKKKNIKVISAVKADECI